MQLSLWSPLLALTSVASAYNPESTLRTDFLAIASLAKLTGSIVDGSLKSHLAEQGVSQSCNILNVGIRREYSTLSRKEKLAYTSAVKCLMAKPAQTPSDQIPGAKSRYDDFVGTHINQTLSIHATGNFLHWHRYFTWGFEQALRNECGYEGYVPYWNWGKSAKDPINSPYFDGSQYSQGGNGVYAEHNCTDALANGINCIPPGQGGGCVTTGPYVDNLANISASFPSLRAAGVTAGPFLGYQPRCIRRDVSPWVSSRWSTDNESYDLLTNATYQTGIGAFQNRMQGDFANGYFGVHSAGHYTIGGDPGGDFFNSPNDPMFWLHHSQIDRTWWVWQNQKPVDRAFDISGTNTVFNTPPSPNTTIEDTINLGIIQPDMAIKNGVSTVAGPYCYIYV
ncbi:tyrosinase [Truncatella angustata]|uniref:Tyrosinase n=1 Tax=Truncatella angustata TaxID=152316 RepID=A0A9P8UWM5_9PEZI|nr:tyrosinase [Truncatella angustata]KAH6659725.1 tyrosinase [Truncatella angustata]